MNATRYAMYLSAAILTAALQALASGGAIRTTVTLNRGWNAVYLEATPDDAAAASFFGAFRGSAGDAPVVSAGVYVSDAYAATAQYDSSGARIAQRPLSYRVWRAADAAGSTLRNVRGGRVYLVCATNACSATYVGVPERPYQSWRVSDESDDSLLNLAGVSSAADGVTPVAYFGEGPAGRDLTVFAVAGTPETGPRLLPVNLFDKARLTPGLGYAVTAVRAAEWPGVLDVVPDSDAGILLRADSPVSALTIRNAGTTSRTVRVSCARSARPGDSFVRDLRVATNVVTGLEALYDWQPFGEGAAVERSLTAGESWRLKFAAEPAAAANAVVTVEDVSSPAAMCVRVPVEVIPSPDAPASFPLGTWVGRLRLTHVSHNATGRLEPAAGAVESLVLMRVGPDGPVMLQRLAAESSSARVSCVLMDPSVPAVVADPGGVFGISARFVFTVAADSKVNPFRHPWHPDHDGVAPGYAAAAPSGDNLENYAGTIKPETFSVSNTVDFVWKSAKWSPGETLDGTVEWRLGGLTAAGDVLAAGTFTMKRITPNLEIDQ